MINRRALVAGGLVAPIFVTNGEIAANPKKRRKRRERRRRAREVDREYRWVLLRVGYHEWQNENGSGWQFPDYVTWVIITTRRVEEYWGLELAPNETKVAVPYWGDNPFTVDADDRGGFNAHGFVVQQGRYGVRVPCRVKHRKRLWIHVQITTEHTTTKQRSVYTGRGRPGRWIWAKHRKTVPLP